MATYSVFVGDKCHLVTQDKRKAKKAYRKSQAIAEASSSAWGEKSVYQAVTLWQGSVTITAK